MIVVPYNPRIITAFTDEYIEITDDDMRKHRLIFEDCANGWVEYVRNSPDFKGVDAQKFINSKCVAATHKISRDMYIKFFSRPIFTFEFRFSLRLLNPGAEFDRLKHLIHEKGWRTYDMS